VVRRYPLGGSSSPWSTTVLPTVGGLDFVEPARVVVVTSADFLQTAVLDSDSGTVLWRTTADSVLRLAGTSALITGGTPGSTVLRRVDLRTGRPLWSRDLGRIRYLDAGDPALGPPRRVVTVDRQGRSAVVSFTDGAVLVTAQLGAAPSPAGDDGRADTAQYIAIGDRLYLARRDNGAASLTAYRLADLRQLWRTTTASLTWPTWCGPYLCGATAAGLTVLDSATGGVRWSDPRWRLGFDTRTIGLPGPPRIAVRDDRERPAVALVDPATGRVLSMLGRSVFVGTNLLRSDTDRLGRTWVQIAGPDNTFPTVGALDTIAPNRCAAVPGYLACPTSAGLTTVWRVPVVMS
jgi:outer membrane protein assembly factor BamB